MQGSPSIKKKEVSSLFDEEDDEEGGIFSTAKKTTSSGVPCHTQSCTFSDRFIKLLQNVVGGFPLLH